MVTSSDWQLAGMGYKPFLCMIIGRCRSSMSCFFYGMSGKVNLNMFVDNCDALCVCVKISKLMKNGINGFESSH